MEFLSSDDRMTAQVCSRSQLRAGTALRDAAILSGADAANPAVGLVPIRGNGSAMLLQAVFWRRYRRRDRCGLGFSPTHGRPFEDEEGLLLLAS